MSESNISPLASNTPTLAMPHQSQKPGFPYKNLGYISFEHLKYASQVPTATNSTTSSTTSLPPIDLIPSRFQFKSVDLPVKQQNNPKKKQFKLKLPKDKKQDKKIKQLDVTTQILYEKGLTNLHDKYELINRRLGDGAGGSVFLVERKSDRKRLAAKLYAKPSSKSGNIEYLKRIAEEVILSSQLHHPNIVDTVDFVSLGDRYYSIMEYCPRDLFDLVSTKDLNQTQVDRLFLQLLSGLTYMHQQGICHRDLKLENLAVDFEGNLKILDFGCATRFRDTMDYHNNQLKGIFGSDPYIAPEMWERDRAYDPTLTDAWSLAVVYVALSTGRFLWDSAKMDDTRFAKFSKEPEEFLKKFKLTPEANEMLLGLLDTNPQTRWTLERVWECSFIQQILQTI
ncbi:kinase-like protein [Conidiobolus coronatus NRRL 28638]|uniref:Kinase-like protein n=1 Tax=Conidiobolus coronatus (strain ATCC 28846 / CBS 209.66 / NRRL 28638) TaxID=796925 RepID=A0A137NPK4_CONC2|nr:kinase-like protein [Conidiobolus coronatus NRRL 28638]|eukprot:KXN64668.1 kinase-like protein [Conidiobolus coronatus NRRL 28638]